MSVIARSASDAAIPMPGRTAAGAGTSGRKSRSTRLPRFARNDRAGKALAMTVGARRPQRQWGSAALPPVIARSASNAAIPMPGRTAAGAGASGRKSRSTRLPRFARNDRAGKALAMTVGARRPQRQWGSAALPPVIARSASDAAIPMPGRTAAGAGASGRKLRSSRLPRFARNDRAGKALAMTERARRSQ